MAVLGGFAEEDVRFVLHGIIVAIYRSEWCMYVREREREAVSAEIEFSIYVQDIRRSNFHGAYKSFCFTNYYYSRYVMVWMPGRLIFLGFNRTPYKHCFYLLLFKNNQVINDWTRPRNNLSLPKL
ncbi:hypothetical protein Ccrd_023343 [Cynara cardunculus var. scolymus]|uniref:Uncharacterized protein n=1 Tax=Cynara cardunculus var. scolymus TaxID=59895 RepID=A0A103XX11_CYNCS|nr:hypothetical protein Ccrd_023343 [Cynara cardunculus var. scolymus]